MFAEQAKTALSFVLAGQSMKVTPSLSRHSPISWRYTDEVLGEIKQRSSGSFPVTLLMAFLIFDIGWVAVECGLTLSSIRAFKM